MVETRTFAGCCLYVQQDLRPCQNVEVLREICVEMYQGSRTRNAMRHWDSLTLRSTDRVSFLPFVFDFGFSENTRVIGLRVSERKGI